MRVEHLIEDLKGRLGIESARWNGCSDICRGIDLFTMAPRASTCKPVLKPRPTLFLTDCSSQSKVYAGNFESFQRRSSVSFLRAALGDALCLQGFPGPRLSRPPPGMRSGLNSDCLNGGKDQVMRGTVVAAEYFEMHIKLAQASGVGWEKVRV